jgi:hypothetical protein
LPQFSNGSSQEKGQLGKEFGFTYNPHSSDKTQATEPSSSLLFSLPSVELFSSAPLASKGKRQDQDRIHEQRQARGKKMDRVKDKGKRYVVG